MTHSMFMAIISFIGFAAVAFVAGRFVWRKSALKDDLHDDFGI